jgi:uncharacterized phiE125 gp8 family phage protein
MGVKVITPPETEPISLDEAKKHCRIDEETDEDDLLSDLITAAREYCETNQNRVYITQTLELTLDKWPCFPMEIPRPPLAEVISVKYTDKDGVETVWPTTEYIVDTDNEPGRIALAYGKSIPSVALAPINGIRMQFIAGSDAVAKKFKQAMLLLIGYWYANREVAASGSVAKEIDFAVSALLSKDVVWI